MLKRCISVIVMSTIPSYRKHLPAASIGWRVFFSASWGMRL
jgi:hypothetical protein